MTTSDIINSQSTSDTTSMDFKSSYIQTILNDDMESSTTYIQTALNEFYGEDNIPLYLRQGVINLHRSDLIASLNNRIRVRNASIRYRNDILENEGIVHSPTQRAYKSHNRHKRININRHNRSKHNIHQPGRTNCSQRFQH